MIALLNQKETEERPHAIEIMLQSLKFSFDHKSFNEDHDLVQRIALTWAKAPRGQGCHYGWPSIAYLVIGEGFGSIDKI